MKNLGFHHKNVLQLEDIIFVRLINLIQTFSNSKGQISEFSHDYSSDSFDFQQSYESKTSGFDDNHDQGFDCPTGANSRNNTVYFHY